MSDSNFGFEPTLDGLNTINSDSSTSTNIICDTIQINTSGTAPTRPPNDNSTNIATTAYVDNATTGIFVTIGTTQIVTGEKTFSNANTRITGNTVTDSIQSSAVGSTQNIATTQTTGVLNIGTQNARTGSINIGSATIGNAPITIGSAASTTQTATHNAITTFSKIPSCAGVPTTADHLCNKTYVDSVAGAVTLGGVNVFTNENDFTNIVKVKDPTLATYAGIDLFSSITPGIVINGAPGTTSALSGVNLNTNTLTVPIKNNQSLIRLRIPMDIAAFGVPSFYFGQLEIIFNSITAITILKNGSFYKTVSVFNLLNFTGTTKSWTGWAFKGENARAYVGDVQFELEITTGNTSVDTYTIGIAVDVAVNATAVGLMTPLFLCTGDSAFTTTHAQSPTSGVTYISTDPASFFPYQINFGNSGNYIIGKSDTYIKTIQGGTLTIDAPTTFQQIPQCAINSIGNNNDLINYATLNARIADVQPYFNPTGTIITFAGSTAPTGYLLCDGAIYAQTTYPSLYSVIFNTYGGSFPNFRVPNTQGLFVSSAGSQTLNSVTYTRTLATRQNHTIQDHKHTYSDSHYYDDAISGQPNGSTADGCLSGAQYQTPGGDAAGMNADEQFQNRLTKGTFLSTATQVNQATAPTVGAITGTETFPANIAFNHYIKY